MLGWLVGAKCKGEGGLDWSWGGKAKQEGSWSPRPVLAVGRGRGDLSLTAVGRGGCASLPASAFAWEVLESAEQSRSSPGSRGCGWLVPLCSPLRSHKESMSLLSMEGGRGGKERQPKSRSRLRFKDGVREAGLDRVQIGLHQSDPVWRGF